MNDRLDRRTVAAMGLAGGVLFATGARAEMMDPNAVLADIAAERRRFAETLQNHDHAALPAFFTADTIVLPANKPLAQGRDAAVAFWTAGTSDPARRLRSMFDMVDSLFADGMVIEAGRAQVFLITAGGDQLIDRGKYIVVWKHEGGRWKRHRDIFNSDGPVA
ncbi:YybH family protein [Sphingosinicella soli]|uniref:Ketosteroid isomerase-like protein n=1 Tax=Sphingosinicella soli TaxID=333708 RepID=A0A7W7B152_9SPHN|nr:nuclear transport factor 2 family protein [Sphingosinicella soli]MBB4631065.1 ketosteroid isomerase-like protein [Sphingosinicella soli]